jgi:hypothetical protein
VSIKLDFSLKDIDRGLKDLEKELGKLKGGEGFAKAGVLGAKAEAQHMTKAEQDRYNSTRRDAQGRFLQGSGAKTQGAAPEGTLSNVDLAMVHEFGTDRVPQRSFIRTSFDANQAKYIERMRLLVQAIYDRKLNIRTALGLLSTEVASDIRNLVREGSGIPPPNAPATIAAKGSSHTLMDTGQLVGAISHQVVMGSGGEEP